QPFDSKDQAEDKFNIAQEVTQPRVSKVIAGYSYHVNKGKKKGQGLTAEGLGGSFTYARLGPRLFGEYRDLGENLPAYEELAKYIFYTETSREFDAAAVNKKTGRIGEHK